MARYQRVMWRHDFADEPVVLYSEIGEDGIETRKVDEYPDGRLDYASVGKSTGTTFLSEKRMPAIEEIAQQGEFEPRVITKEDFEAVWDRAVHQDA